MPIFDTVILGAGVAGLSAARDLSHAGQNVLLLEARNRIGGRILTRRDPTLRTPIELGAEFVHGAPPETLEIVAAAGLGLHDVTDTHFTRMRPGAPLRDTDFWQRIGAVLELLDPKRKADRTFAEFLDAHKKKFDRETQDLAKSFVEGFHAAWITELSEKGLAEAEQATAENADAMDSLRSFRIFEGYDAIPRRLFESIERPQDVVRLNRVATKLHWSQGRVEVTAVHRLTGLVENYTAKCAIITLPLGVLKADPEALGGLNIQPRLPQLDKILAGLRMGSAIRITFKFRKRLWDNLADEPVGMMHASSQAAFPTWWTPLPVRAPLITGWAGGPKALAAYQASPQVRTRMALDSLAELLDCSMASLSSALESAHHHDWQRDPFARGSYSWVAVGGADRAKEFAQPFADTVYFAGEATNSTAARGTVDGAIASGLRAAQQVLERFTGA